MNIWTKIALIPMVSFILMIVTVGIMGSFVEYSWMKNNLPSGFPIFASWAIILGVALGIQSFRTRL